MKRQNVAFSGIASVTRETVTGRTRQEIRQADIAAALSRVSSGETFRNAPQLVSFLSFVVAKTLVGQEHAIKGYTIATEALGRPDDFDPQTDAIVRVEAGRLRRALDIYYMGQGKTDPVRIVIPRGTYVPRFEAVAANSPASPSDAEPPIPQGSEGRGTAEPRAPSVSSPVEPTSDRIGLARRAGAALVVASAVLVVLYALHHNETGWLARAVRAPLAAPAAGSTESPAVGAGAKEAARRPAA
jgi:hypothetical protein